MRRNTPLRRSTPLRRTSPPKQAADSTWTDAKTIVWTRDYGRCVRCANTAQDAHHRIPRGMGGRNHDPRVHSPERLICLCRTCHDWIETNRTDAYQAGWLVRTGLDPALTPVRYPYGWYLLPADGTRTTTTAPTAPPAPIHSNRRSTTQETTVRAPHPTASRTCPACARRYAMLIDPTCPICHGTGTLTLTRAVTDLYSPAAGSLAVEYALEAAARQALAANPTAAGITLARQALTTTITRLHQAHITEPPDPQDQASLAAPPLHFDWDEHPLAAGGIPGFSAAGYICHLARACDPLDPLHPTDGNTMTTAGQRTATRHKAKVLAKTATTPPTPRRRP